MKKIVVIGGGSGIFNVLKGLKKYKVSITSIVTMFDNGGSTGILRDEFGTLPPGDVRRSLVALAPNSGDSILRDLFSFRFPEKSSLQGHSFGNLFLQALTAISGNEVEAIKKASELLQISHKILPVSITNAHLCALLEDGSIIKGEKNIDVPKHDGSIKIKGIFLEPKAEMYTEAYNAILEADLIVIGPGDLYTSILPNTIVNGFSEAINKTKAKTAYVLNIMTKWGETNDFKASDFVKELLHYIKKDKVDYVLCGNTEIHPDMIEKYKKEKATPVFIDTDELKKYTKKIIKEDIVLQSKILRHDSKKISKIIMGL